MCQPDPEGEGQGTEKGGSNADTAGEDTLVAHLLCHDIAGRGRDASQHDEKGDQLFICEAAFDGQRKEDRRQDDQLDKCGNNGRFEVTQSGLALEACADGKECQWTCQAGKAGKRLTGDGGHRQAEQGIDKAQGDTNQDRIGEDPLDAGLDLIAHAGLRIGGWAFNRQDQDSKNVVERHAAQDHQAGHTRSAVNILDERCTEDSGGGTVTGLNEFADDVFVFEEMPCQKPDDKDAYKGRDKAEQNILAIEIGIDVGGGKVTEKLHRQGNAENKFVGGRHKAVLEKTFAVEQVAQQHDKEQGHGAVQAENKIFHPSDSPVALFLGGKLLL